MTRINRRTWLAGTSAGLALTQVPAWAQAFPARPVKIIVPYAPGGATDILARMVGTKLAEGWGQPVVVENKPGASGNLGNDFVAKSAPDGYTLLMGITALIQGPGLFPKLPYDPYKDLQPLSQIAVSTSVLAVPMATPVKNLAEYVALLKSQPGKHGYGSYGIGTSAHIQGENFKAQTATDMVHVAYKGSAPLLTDLIGGQLSCAFLDVGSAKQHLKAGTFKLLGVTGTERLKMLPDVPTFAELGLKNFEPRGWFGMLMPAGAPPALVQKIAGDIARIVQMPDVKARIDDMGLLPVGNTPDEFAAIARTDGALYARMFKELNIKLE